MGQIRWTEKASKNLQAIYEYIAKDSKTYALRFIRSLIKATQKLETMPRCGRAVPELEGYGFKELIHQNFRIVYRTAKNGDDIEILAVVHSAREIGKALEEE